MLLDIELLKEVIESDPRPWREDDIRIERLRALFGREIASKLLAGTIQD